MNVVQAIMLGPDRVWTAAKAYAETHRPGFSFHVTTTPWAVIIALSVLALALILKHVFNDVIEDEDAYLRVIVLFLVVYIAAAFAVGTLNPV